MIQTPILSQHEIILWVQDDRAAIIAIKKVTSSSIRLDVQYDKSLSTFIPKMAALKKSYR
jgi:hypothetical protein